MSGPTPIDQLLSKPVRKKLRLTNIRIAFQIFFFGGFTISLDGDLEEFDEFFNAFANCNSSSAMRFIRSSICLA